MARGFLSGFAKAMIFRKLDALGAGDSDDEFRKDGSKRVMRVRGVGFAWRGVELCRDGDEQGFGIRVSGPEVKKRVCRFGKAFAPMG